MNAYLALGVEYRDQSEHLESVMAYLKRCKRVKWQAEDLRRVCDFLRERKTAEAEKLKLTLARKGIKMFPDEGCFHLVGAEAEMDKGPRRANLQLARGRLQRALELSKNSANPMDEQVAESARSSLTMVDELLRGYMDDFDDDEFDDDDFDDREAGPFVPPFNFDPANFKTDGNSREDILGSFLDMCDQLGIDGEEMLDRAAQGESYRDMNLRDLKKEIAKRRKQKNKRRWY